MLVCVPCYLMIFCCMFRSLIVLCIFVMARVGGFCVVCWFVVWLSLFLCFVYCFGNVWDLVLVFGFWALALFDFGFGCVCCVCCYLVVVFCLLIVRTWTCGWFGVLVIVADFALDLMVWFGVIWVWVVRTMWICGWVVFGCIVGCVLPALY